MGITGDVLAPDLIHLAVQLTRALEDAAIEYAIGGALALSVWGRPRGTEDIDIAVFVPETGLERVLAVFRGAGADVDTGICHWQMKNWRHAEIEFLPFIIDLFVPDFELYDWAHPRRRRVEMGGQLMSFWSAEDVLLFKLLFFRLKDKADIDSLMRVQRENLDLEYIRKALREIFADEERSRWFEEEMRDVFGSGA
ncbi:MAG: nucleotidyltransferase [Candidatus Wallbacteria bacterium]|nr:nucleotidyltransferase [Candidatus Wallbacteria bacterium]